MPATTSAAAIGAARNSRRTVSINALPSRRLFQRGRELRHVVVKELNVVARFLHATDRRRQYEYRAADAARDRLRRLEAEVGLHDDELHALALHLVDELDDVRRWRGDAGLGLDVPDDVQAPPLHEVRPGAVVRHELRALVRRER